MVDSIADCMYLDKTKHGLQVRQKSRLYINT